MLIGCGGARPPHAPVRADRWSALTWEERHDVMTFAVLPNMARSFRDFQKHDAPDMTCRTCHGKDAEARQYAMPSGLPALDPKHLPDKSNPTAKFMIEEVTPQMADLIGREVTCFTCHPVKR